MRYTDISETMRAFIGAREGFRKLGFSADDLFCETAKSARLSGALACFCLLKTKGKQFRVECGPVDDRDAFEKEYERVCQEIATVPQDELDRIWTESEVFRNKVSFLMALTARGISPPRSFS